jgi:hypothetical protein
MLLGHIVEQQNLFFSLDTSRLWFGVVAFSGGSLVRSAMCRSVMKRGLTCSASCAARWICFKASIPYNFFFSGGDWGLVCHTLVMLDTRGDQPTANKCVITIFQNMNVRS